MACTLTLITACFNSSKTIDLTLGSVLGQGYRDFEYIVVDGGSSDGTLDILRMAKPEFAARGISFKWISEPDRGIYDAWNKALAMSEGQWISFIGADDVLVHDALEHMSSLANPEVDFLSAKAEMISGGQVVREFGEPFDFEVFKREMKILHAGGWHNATFFKYHGPFDDTFKIAGDYELLLRARQDLRVITSTKVIIRMGAEGVSSTRILQGLREAAKAKVKNGLRPPFKAWLDCYWVLIKVKLRTLFPKTG